jgi:predicted nucleic acid-binding protein
VILTDSNILVRSIYPQDPQHTPAVRALIALRRRGETLCIAPQNLIELWVVATRPRADNGLGMDIATVSREVTDLRKLFFLLPYTADVVREWQRIVTTQGVSGKQTHDAHLVAMMLVHSVTSILTFNGRHFKRYPGITALNPEEI